MGVKRAARKRSQKSRRKNLLSGGGANRDKLNPDPPGVIRSGRPGAKQINRDEDLFRLFVSIFDDDEDEGDNNPRPGRRARFNKRFSPHIGKPSAKRFADIATSLSGGGARAQKFTIEARKFLNEREAANKGEKKRLRRGSSRTASVIRAARNSDTQTTALGRTSLSGRSSRVRNLVNDSSRLGQIGSLG